MQKSKKSGETILLHLMNTWVNSDFLEEFWLWRQGRGGVCVADIWCRFYSFLSLSIYYLSLSHSLPFYLSLSLFIPLFLRESWKREKYHPRSWIKLHSKNLLFLPFLRKKWKTKENENEAEFRSNHHCYFKRIFADNEFGKLLCHLLFPNWTNCNLWKTFYVKNYFYLFLYLETKSQASLLQTRFYILYTLPVFATLKNKTIIFHNTRVFVFAESCLCWIPLYKILFRACQSTKLKL